MQKLTFFPIFLLYVEIFYYSSVHLMFLLLKWRIFHICYLRALQIILNWWVRLSCMPMLFKNNQNIWLYICNTIFKYAWHYLIWCDLSTDIIISCLTVLSHRLLELKQLFPRTSFTSFNKCSYRTTAWRPLHAAFSSARVWTCPTGISRVVQQDVHPFILWCWCERFTQKLNKLSAQ